MISFFYSKTHKSHLIYNGGAFMRRYIPYIIFAAVILNIIVWPKTEAVEQFYGVENEVYMFNVSINGEVLLPDSYPYFKSVTYEEVINNAGGLTSDADISQINLHQEISTTTTIIIPSKDEEDKEQVMTKVNVNEADFSELIEIPGMTEKKAANLIIYREQHGAFASIDDLILVSYIGSATLEKIRPYITI